MKAGKMGNRERVEAYSVGPGLLVHPGCFFEAGKSLGGRNGEPENRWRGMEIKTLWYRPPKRGWICTICRLNTPPERQAGGES